MGPTYYDILGVAPDASAEEIKRAWREAADRFEPGSAASGNQFRLFNQAAEVLLDPARRAAYDAELAGPAEQASAPEAPLAATAEPTPPAPAPAVAAEPGQEGAPVATPLQAPSGWLLVVLGSLALALIVAVAVYGIPMWRTVRHHDAVVAARQQATPAAERAADAVLSYDYKSLNSDEKAAQHYLTKHYAKQYVATFNKLVKPNATKLHAHVTADVQASGVVHADPDRVAVLLFVNQTTHSTANNGQPQTALNRVEMSMVKQGGGWQVDGITSY